MPGSGRPPSGGRGKNFAQSRQRNNVKTKVYGSTPATPGGRGGQGALRQPAARTVQNVASSAANSGAGKYLRSNGRPQNGGPRVTAGGAVGGSAVRTTGIGASRKAITAAGGRVKADGSLDLSGVKLSQRRALRQSYKINAGRKLTGNRSSGTSRKKG